MLTVLNALGWVIEHLFEVVGGALIVGMVGLIAWLILFGPREPSMTVRGYVPTEDGERVVCVLDVTVTTRTTMSGKTPITTTTKSYALVCSPDEVKVEP